MAFLFQLRFNDNGPSMGTANKGVSFKDTSPCFNGKKCCTFTPYMLDNGIDISKSIVINGDFTIYFKYKVNVDLMEDNSKIPIISYKKPNDSYNYPFIFIQDKKFFSLLLSDGNAGVSTSLVENTFDDCWHTLCITRKGNTIRTFVDGYCTTENTFDEFKESINLGNTINIGYRKADDHNVDILHGGSLDDICITDSCVYEKSFIPPTMYFTGSDSISNYYEYNKSNNENISQDVKDMVEKQIEHSARRLNRAQFRILPRRLRIQWHEEKGYFRNMKYIRVPSNTTDTVLSLFGMENPIYGNDHIRFFEGFADKLIKKDLLQPFMMFLNDAFVPLSKIYIVRSDWYYTVFIKGRDPYFEGKVKKLEMVTIPFYVLYEEGLEEKEDQKPLYVFNKEGRFNPQEGFYYYYIDKKRTPKSLKFSGILDQYIPSVLEKKEEESNNNGNNNFTDPKSDARYMHSYWRYGMFEQSDANGNDAVVTFVDSQNPEVGWIREDTEVLIYENGTMYDKQRYRVVGKNKIQFLNYQDDDLLDHLITLQIISDTRDLLVEDLTNMKVVTVEATVDNQSTFMIPQLESGDGIPYSTFLIFRGSVVMNQYDRFIMDDDRTKITFTNTEDFVPKGSSIYFCFLKIRKADMYGALHVKPIFLYTRTEKNVEADPTEYAYNIPIPTDGFGGMEFNENNVMLFVGDVFISPYRYEIKNNTIMVNQSGFGFIHDRSAMLVCFKMVNRFEDPLDKVDKIIQDENNKGKRYVLYDLNLDGGAKYSKYWKITLDNFVTFDNKGRYIPDLMGEVYNRNIIKGLYTTEPLDRVPRYLTVIYDQSSMTNGSNTILETNDDFMSSYVLMREEMYEMDPHFKEWMSNYEYQHIPYKHYGENISNALDYTIGYNQMKLNEIYYKRQFSSRYTFDTAKLNNMMTQVDNKWVVDINREHIFHDVYYRTYCIFYVNGVVPEWQKDITYDGNIVRLSLNSKFGDNDRVEVIRIGKIINLLEPLENTVKRIGGGVINALLSGNLNLDKNTWNGDIGINNGLIFDKSMYENILPGDISFQANNTEVDIDSEDLSYEKSNINIDINGELEFNNDLIVKVSYNYNNLSYYPDGLVPDKPLINFVEILKEYFNIEGIMKTTGNYGQYTQQLYLYSTEEQTIFFKEHHFTSVKQLLHALFSDTDVPLLDELEEILDNNAFMINSNKYYNDDIALLYQIFTFTSLIGRIIRNPFLLVSINRIDITDSTNHLIYRFEIGDLYEALINSDSPKDLDIFEEIDLPNGCHISLVPTIYVNYAFVLSNEALNALDSSFNITKINKNNISHKLTGDDQIDNLIYNKLLRTLVKLTKDGFVTHDISGLCYNNPMMVSYIFQHFSSNGILNSNNELLSLKSKYFRNYSSFYRSYIEQVETYETYFADWIPHPMFFAIDAFSINTIFDTPYGYIDTTQIDQTDIDINFDIEFPPYSILLNLYAKNTYLTKLPTIYCSNPIFLGNILDSCPLDLTEKDNDSLLSFLKNIDFASMEIASYLFCGVKIQYLNLNSLSITNVNWVEAKQIMSASTIQYVYWMNWKMPNISITRDMFIDCSSLVNIDLSKWDVSNVIRMDSMFQGCRSLVNIDLSKWDVSNVTRMDNMFDSCRSLVNIDLSKWDVSNVTNMSYMFGYCSSLVSIDLSKWDVSNVKYIDYMFERCSSLVSIDLSGWDTSNVTDIHGMFDGCSKLKNITNFTIDCKSLKSWSDAFKDVNLDPSNIIKIKNPNTDFLKYLDSVNIKYTIIS